MKKKTYIYIYPDETYIEPRGHHDFVNLISRPDVTVYTNQFKDGSKKSILGNNRDRKK